MIRRQPFRRHPSPPALNGRRFRLFRLLPLAGFLLLFLDALLVVDHGDTGGLFDAAKDQGELSAADLRWPRYLKIPENAIRRSMLNADDSVSLPVLAKAGLAHVQFETIHPFLDGKGRVGLLLITFLLCQYGVLRKPMLSLSLCLKQNRDEYYCLLDQARTDGDWESWIQFFLEGVRLTADSAVKTAQSLIALFQQDHGRIQEAGRAAGSALGVHDLMRERPLTTLQEVGARTGIPFRAA